MKHLKILLISALGIVAIILIGCGDDEVTSSPADTGPWKQAYGGLLTDIGFALADASDGGFLVAGLTNSAGTGGGDMLLLRIDSLGDSLWAKAVGGVAFDIAFSVAATADGGFVVAGATESFGAGDEDVYLVKVNAAGDTAWTRTYGGASKDEGHRVIQTSDGGFLIAGMTESSTAGGSDAYVIKVDSAGAVEWSHTYGGTERDYAESCIQTLDGGFAIVGTTHSFGAGESDVYLIRLQSDGSLQWAKPLGESGEEKGNDITETATGTLWVVGSSNSYEDGTDSYVGESGGGDAYILKVNAAGNKVSSSGVGATGNDFLTSIVQKADGRVVGLGFSQSTQGWSGIYVVQVSPYTSGIHHQSNLYGTTSYCYANGAVTVTDGGIVIAGGSVAPGNIDVLVYNIGPWVQ